MGQNSIDIWILSIVKQVASPDLMHSGMVHEDNLEGWDGEGDRSGVQNGEHM